MESQVVIHNRHIGIRRLQRPRGNADIRMDGDRGEMKKRLFAVALTALTPAIGMLAYNEFWYRQQRDAEIHAQALQTSRQVASEVDRILEGARSLLIATSVAPSVNSGDPMSCNGVLADVAKQVPSVSTISMAGLDGTVLCSSQAARVGTNVADRYYFRQALKTEQFVIGGYTKSRLTGFDVLPVARVLLRGGQPRGVLVTGLKLSWLQARLQERGMIADGTVTIADKDGVILARTPPLLEAVGTKIAERYMHLLHAPRPGTLEARGRDGVLRIVGYQPMSSDSPIYVAAGIAKDSAFATINRATMTAIILIALGGLASAIAAVFVGNRFILRPIVDVVSVLERWAGGDIAARTGMHGSYGEVGQVGASVDQLLDELERRRIQAEEAEVARNFLTRELSHRVKNTLSVVQAIARQTFGRIVPPDAIETYSLRVRALAGAYDTLLLEDWESGDIHDVVNRAISPHHDPANNRFRTEGPSFSLPPPAVVALTLVIHELATNAAKYGSLSDLEGYVSIAWSVDNGRITLDWSEHGGPPVSPPAKEGFGTKVISRAFPPDYQPDVVFDYRPKGLRFAVAFKPSGQNEATAKALDDTTA
jgi:two-component sensor histidine kinase